LETYPMIEKCPLRVVIDMPLMGQYDYKFLPGHSRSNLTGQVYTHILIAEQLLNRSLLKEEVVHHKDHNKNNNRPENLMVFATKGDHTRFHNYGCDEATLVLTEAGNYIVPQAEGQSQCQYCGSQFIHKRSSKRKFCSPQCYKLSKQAEHEPKPERDQLLCELSTMTKTQVAKKYNVSRTTINRWVAGR